MSTALFDIIYSPFMIRVTFIFWMVFTSLLSAFAQSGEFRQDKHVMMYGDSVRTGVPFSKDPHVVWFKNRYLMYYSVPSYTDPAGRSHGWGIAVATSGDLVHWNRLGEINADPDAHYESKGIAAPCALVIDNKVHLFYQTYGNGREDAICHAWSEDGVKFNRNTTNPIFRPDGSWNCGRAIDAEVIPFNGRYFLYYATRDTSYKIQMLGVAVAPGDTDFKRSDWQNLSVGGPVIKPELHWEKDCVEGASVINRNGELFMFYAGGYNNAPQQIGLAKSTDGMEWVRLSEEPFLPNGKPGEWNESESGHPHIFANPAGGDFLFFQGNNTKGKSWYLSAVGIDWESNRPIMRD
jgi:beta-1,2-mannobiose phosphorylase / 1,2-beta-oligomannan phosphorylase